MSNLAYERMRASLEQLHLSRALETVDTLLDRAAGGELTTVGVDRVPGRGVRAALTKLGINC